MCFEKFKIPSCLRKFAENRRNPAIARQCLSMSGFSPQFDQTRCAETPAVLPFLVWGRSENGAA
jgi:hypothetical protein